MNILHVVNISFVIPYFLGKQLSHFKRKGYNEFIVCSPSNDLQDLSISHQFEYCEIDVLRKISITKDLQAIVKMMKYMSRCRIDVVTGHTPKGALLAMLASFLMRIPIRIYFRHGLVYETSFGFKRKLLMALDRMAGKLATIIVCVSPSVYNRSLQDGLNSKKKQILLSKGTCNGVDIDRFSRSSIDKEYVKSLRLKLGFEEHNWVIGFTGRLVKDKGLIELVEAFNLLQRKHTDIKLLLVGMLEERDILPNDIVNEIRNNSSIITTGYIENSVIENYYALMNVLILPSYREGFPTSILEASSMELPIVTTKVTGCIDAIIENETGLFVEHNGKSIADALEVFYENRVLSTVLGINGRNFIKTNFEQHIIWDEIEKLYERKLVK